MTEMQEATEPNGDAAWEVQGGDGFWHLSLKAVSKLCFSTPSSEEGSTAHIPACQAEK